MAGEFRKKLAQGMLKKIIIILFVVGIIIIIALITSNYKYTKQLFSIKNIK